MRLRIGTTLMVVTLFSCSPPLEEGTSNPFGLIVEHEGLKIDLLAAEPDIVTPTGVAVDAQNRIWVIENHTHERQDDYAGPKADRILVFDGYLDANKENKVIEYATDFINGMSLSLKSDGNVLVTTRANIIEFEDTDGDMVSDSRKTLISLDTEETFPHNGMSGMVIGPGNNIYFQCGENFGSYYEITGTDGTTLVGQEREGGSIYRCNLDGSGLERYATAVWNCFAMAFDDYGNLFAVENDPDSRPPCRMLHIVKGGNYGFQFQHGRDGLSPLTSWFGEIPGTLPMVAGTGEAPSGVIYYGSDKLGDSLKNSFVVTAWGDNQVEHFPIEKKGSSFTAEKNILVRGGRDFYPVGLAIDNEGGIIASDWADVSYAVHGKGRIYRLAGSGNNNSMILDSLTSDSPNEELIVSLSDQDIRIRTKAAQILAEKGNVSLQDLFRSRYLSDPGKMNLLWAAGNSDHAEYGSLLTLGLRESNELIRAAAVKLIEETGVGSEATYLSIMERDSSPYVLREAIYGLQSKRGFDAVKDQFKKDDPFIHTAIIETFGKPSKLGFLMDEVKNEDAAIRRGAALCLRRSRHDRAKWVIPDLLNDEDPLNRIVALKWVAEDKLEAFRGSVERSFAKLEEVSPDLFNTYMTTFQYLDGAFNEQSHFMEGDVHVGRSFYKRQKFLLAAAKNKTLNYDIRSRCLSAVNPNYEELDLFILTEFVDEGDPGFQVEAVRSIAARKRSHEEIYMLNEIAGNDALDESVRLEAIVGLHQSITSNEDVQNLFTRLLAGSGTPPNIKREVAVGLTMIDDTAINRLAQAQLDNGDDGKEIEWSQIGYEDGDALAGSRVFFNPKYQCVSCHRVNGRGGVFGPDLSKVGGNIDRDRILQSILDPSELVGPIYAGYAVTTKDDDLVVGRLDTDLDSKRHLQMILADGSRVAVPYDDIVDQTALDESLMPVNLHQAMRPDEFRDLITYLAGLE